MAITAPPPKPSGEGSVLGQIAGSGTASSAGRVYMGEFPLPGAPKGASAQSRKNIYETERRQDRSRWSTEAEAISEFYSWSAKDQQAILSKGIVGGLLKFGDGPMEAGQLWTKLVKEASKYGAAGAKVSPIDLLASYVKAAGGAGQNSWQSMGAFEVNIQNGAKRYVGPGTYLGDGKALQTDTRTDLTDPDTAKAIATKLFQDLMGRDPGAGELGAFGNALASAEASNPITQSTTTQYDMNTGQAINSDTTSSGGVSAEGKAYIGEQQIKKNKEYGVTQAVTTYQNAFENLIYGAPE